MEIKFYNTPEPQSLTDLPEDVAFLSYQPDFDRIKKTADQFADKKHLIIIGHGGSISSFAGMYGALQGQATKQVHIVSTIDPDYITEVKQLAPVAETLVIAISKSGETVTQIEALLQFLDYELLFITGSMGPLAAMADKLGARLLLHPPIGGRFTGMTEVALVPAELCGFNVQAMFEAAQKTYLQYKEDNDAAKAASIFYQLEEQGTVDVYLPVYDHHLFGMTDLIVQLCHESFGKDGKGQTYFAHEAPEAQHHTNQRFLGGRKNIAGWFMGTSKPLAELTTQVPKELTGVKLKDHDLQSLNDIPLSAALRFEMEGTMEDARIRGIPLATQLLTSRSAEEVGSLIAFWQLYAIYSACWRKVNPFDQPEVENSKDISFAKRLNHGGTI